MGQIVEKPSKKKKTVDAICIKRTNPIFMLYKVMYNAWDNSNYMNCFRFIEQY